MLQCFMPTIRLDQDVFEGLQQLAKPFVDSPSMVIRRLLEERGVLRAAAKVPKSVRLAPDALTPQGIY
jgi:predicted transcriptional regulator